MSDLPEVCLCHLTPWHIGNVDCQTLDLAATEPVVGPKVISDASRGAILLNLQCQLVCPRLQQDELLVLSVFMWCAVGQGTAWNIDMTQWAYIIILFNCAPKQNWVACNRRMAVKAEPVGQPVDNQLDRASAPHQISVTWVGEQKADIRKQATDAIETDQRLRAGGKTVAT